MPSKKRITRVRFNDVSRRANRQPSNQNTTRPANQRSISPGNTRTASQQSTLPDNTGAARPLQITTPTSTRSSNASTPLTPSPHVPTFDIQ